ncbi:hypothetical protein NBRC116602_03230 [Hyphomicrobiales bacterium 4NK60-0047b]
MKQNRWSLTGLLSLKIFDLIASVAALVAVYAYFSEAPDRQLNRLATNALAKEMLFVRLDRNRNQGRSKFEVAETFHTLRELGVQTSSIDLSDLSFYKLVIRPFDTLRGENVTIYQCRFQENSGGVLGSIYLHLKMGELLNCELNGAHIFAGDYNKDAENKKRYKFGFGIIAGSRITCGYGSKLHFENIVLLNVRFQNCHKNQIVMKGVSLSGVDLGALKDLELTNSCVGENVIVPKTFKTKPCDDKIFTRIRAQISQ